MPLSSTVLYRSTDIPRGHFRTLGCLHLHVDGGGQYDLLTDMLTKLDQVGVFGKLTLVTNSVAGPQRLIFPETYASHTPGAEGKEDFAYFSTISLPDRDSTVLILRETLPRLSSHANMVVEVERVVATIEDGIWTAIDHDAVREIDSRDVGYVRSPSLPFEIHHAIDISADESGKLDLESLAVDLTDSGITAGGWFTFSKIDECSFRSNAFVKNPSRESVMSEHKIIDKYLKSHGLASYRLWTIVERILGIWKTPSPAFE